MKTFYTLSLFEVLPVKLLKANEHDKKKIIEKIFGYIFIYSSKYTREK